MRIVADTHAFLAVALMEPERDAIIARSKGHEVVAPEILPYEMGNALVSMLRKGALSATQVPAAWDILRGIPVELRPVDIGVALRMAVQCRIHAYDAYFLACAWSLRAPLLTLDRVTQRSARILEIPVLEIPA